MLRWIIALCAAGLLIAPASAQTQATQTAVESSHIFCTSTCQIYGGSANNTNAAARWIMLFDSATVPGDGAVTGCLNAAATRPCILKWYQIGASSSIGVADFLMFNAASRIPVSKGFVAVCSSTGPFTKTATADCTFSFEVMSQ